MAESAPQILTPGWRQGLKDLALIIVVVSAAFGVSVQAGWIMTRDAHAQDIRRVDEAARDAQRFRSDTRLLVKFLVCSETYGRGACEDAYRGVIDLDGLLNP